MTLPMLEPAEKSLGPALASLTDTIGSILNPTAQADATMKAALLQKPELAQKLIDYAKANGPEALTTLGLSKNFANNLSGLRESTPALIDRSIRPDVTAAMSNPNSPSRKTAAQLAETGQTPGQAASDEFYNWITTKGAELLDGDPKLAADAIRARLTQTTGVGSDTQRAQAALDQQAAAAAGRPVGLNPDGSKMYVRDMTVDQIANGITAGTLKAEDISGVDPATRIGVEQALRQINREQDTQQQKNLAQFRIDNNDTEGKMFMKMAADEYRTTNAGSPAAWYKTLSGRDDMGTPSDADMSAVQDALKNQGIATTVATQQKFMKALQPEIDAIQKPKGKLTDAIINTHINAINELLKSKGSPYTAEYGKTGWFSSGIVYKDSDGNLTENPEDLLSTAAKGGDGPGRMSAHDAVINARATLNGVQHLQAQRWESMIVNKKGSEAAAERDAMLARNPNQAATINAMWTAAGGDSAGVR